LKKDLTFAAVAFIAIGAVCFGLAAARPLSPIDPSPPLAEKNARKTSANDPVVMKVNGEPITESEFHAFIAEAPEQMQFFYASPDGRRLLAKELVKLKALEQEGRRLGIAEDPQISSRISVNETNLIAGSALRRLIGAPSEDRLRNEYEKEKGQLETTELSHILLAVQGGGVPPRSGNPPPEAQALQEAQRLVSRIRGGADFAAIARAESDDQQSAANGGSLGPVQPGALPPNIQNVVASLKPGQISDPVKSEFGIHIFKVGERQSQPYEAVRDALAARIQRDEAQAAMTRLEQAAQVELDPKFFGTEKKPAQPGT
jgi:hypothetical protein